MMIYRLVSGKHAGTYVWLNQCNLQLENELVKDHNGKTVDSHSKDVQNDYKENQNIDTKMTIEVNTENVWNEFKEQMDKKRYAGYWTYRYDQSIRT